MPFLSPKYILHISVIFSCTWDILLSNCSFLVLLINLQLNFIATSTFRHIFCGRRRDYLLFDLIWFIAAECQTGDNTSTQVAILPIHQQDFTVNKSWIRSWGERTAKFRPLQNTRQSTLYERIILSREFQTTELLWFSNTICTISIATSILHMLNE